MPLFLPTRSTPTCKRLQWISKYPLTLHVDGQQPWRVCVLHSPQCPNYFALQLALLPRHHPLPHEPRLILFLACLPFSLPILPYITSSLAPPNPSSHFGDDESGNVVGLPPILIVGTKSDLAATEQFDSNPAKCWQRCKGLGMVREH